MTPPTQRRIAVFGGSFNPPGRHHHAIAEHLAGNFDEVAVIPCGPRPDKPVTNDVEPVHRATMVDMTFRGIPGVRVDLFDLENEAFTRTHVLDEMLRSAGEPWHVVGADLTRGGAGGRSPIQSEWSRGEHLWRNCRFAVLKRPGYELDPADLPPHSRVFEFSHNGASSDIRGKVFRHESIADEVLPEVAAYVERHGLYRGPQRLNSTRFMLEDPRLLVICNEQNPEAREIASRLGPVDTTNPNLIVVVGGDGTMLKAIRQHWRLRVPFYGISAGTLGFLLNRSRPESLVRHEFILRQLPLLRIETERPDGSKHDALAFNDAWVERSSGQTAWIELSVNGQRRMPMLMADGALISTASGSTSYARAMGAAPLPLTTPALLLVGSNVLRPAFWKPVILPLDSRIELTGLDLEKRPLRGYIDGVPQGEVRSMRARLSNIAAVELAFDPHLDPAEKLAQIQFPPPV